MVGIMAGETEKRSTCLSDHQCTFTLDEYRYILTCGKQSGYRFVDFKDLKNDLSSPYCVLRHDIDSDLRQAAALGAVEKEIGVQSTYFLMLHSPIYNLFSRANTAYVNSLLENGHDIGLHADELYYASGSTDQMNAHIHEEVGLLEKTFGTKIHAVSFHQPGQRILENDIALPDGLLNTYNRNDMAGIHYISDSNMTWQEACPSILFREQRYARLQLLMHPMWWTPSPMPVETKWNRALVEQFELMQDQLLECERAYGPERSFVIQ